jgi:ABC-type oligopeptide transport system substrate-binding subunit
MTQKAWHVLVPLLGACIVFTGVSAPPVGAEPVRHRPSAPHMGGTITVRNGEAPDCLDPQETTLLSSGFVIQAVADTLVSLDARENVVPYLTVLC